MHRARQLCALFVAVAAGAGSLGGCGAASVRAAPTAPTAPTLSPAGTGDGRHGGRANPPPVVPSGITTWPAVVPVPPGVTQSSHPSPGVWVVGALMDGDATAVRASLVQLFGGHGFTVNPVAETPIILTSATYTIRVSMFPRDHSAQTDVAITLTSR